MPALFPHRRVLAALLPLVALAAWGLPTAAAPLSPAAPTGTQSVASDRVGVPPAASSGTMPADPAHPAVPWAWEPGMSADPRGWTWAAGNHCPLLDNHLFTSGGLCHDPTSMGGLPTFAPVWLSRDGGRSYRFVADPLRNSKAAAAASPGGEDTDVAVQPVSRPGRTPLLYVISAWAVSATLAISGDDGATWRLAQITGAPLTAAGIDRPWLAASGACELFLQYHPLTGSQNLAAAPRVDHFDGCALFDTAAAGEVAATPLSSTPVEPPAEQLNGVQVMGKLVASGGRVFLSYLACDVVPETNLNCNGPADHQGLHVASSADSGASWQDHLLPDAGLLAPLNDGVWPISMGADGQNLAVAVTDTQHVHLWTSADAGSSWRLHPQPLDAPLSWNFATVPSVAVRGALVSVAWNGSGPAAASASPASRSASASQEWRLVLARSRDGGTTFTVTPLDPVLATTPAGTPLADLLYDDFGALLAADGATLLTYTQSCAGKAPTDPACPGPPTPGAQGTFEMVRYARVEALAPAPVVTAGPRAPTGGLPNTSR